MIFRHRERSRRQGDRGIPEPVYFTGEDMPRKPLDVRLTDYPPPRGNSFAVSLCLSDEERGWGRAPSITKSTAFHGANVFKFLGHFQKWLTGDQNASLFCRGQKSSSSPDA